MVTFVQERNATGRAFLSDLSEEERRLFERIPAVVDYMDHASFGKSVTEDALFGENVAAIEVPGWCDFPDAPEESTLPRAKRRNLNAEDEASLFLRFNYAKYRLSGLVSPRPRRLSARKVGQMVLWYRRAMKARANLVRANMALVIAMAKRTRIPNVDFGELISEGNMAMLRSVEKFDVSRGFKFSTYACRSILKSFNRLATKTGRYRQRFPVEFDPDMETGDYDSIRHDEQWDDSVDSVREVVMENRANLSELERRIVVERFAIISREKGLTLAEVGKIVGLTNERVRQIQKLAIGKIRDVLCDSYLAK